MKTIKLKESGSEMPVLALGTARANGEPLANAIKYALKCGYRHFDCAWLYANEEIIGKALKEAIDESNGNLKREDLFLTSKCWYTFNSKEAVKTVLKDTLNELKTDYLDLYILHWPISFKENVCEEISHPYTPVYTDVNYVQMYKAMEELMKEGKIKNIGVSNFNISQLQDILNLCDIKPVINQIEIHPYLQNEELIDFCKKNDILVSCYGPLGAGEKSKIKDIPKLLENETLINIGKKYNKTSAQVCLRWSLQKGLVVIPKSVTPSRILENSQIFDFELSEEDILAIHNINKKLSVYSMDLFNQQFKRKL